MYNKCLAKLNKVSLQVDIRFLQVVTNPELPKNGQLADRGGHG